MPETERVAIVTGAAGGIGRAMVRGLLTAGIRVAAVDRDREPLEALSESAREQGNAAECHQIEIFRILCSGARPVHRAGECDLTVDDHRF
jgi:NAD(P)-dependent dehydrogenase (short-subunit alcohol dehydrogenase family)